LAISYDKANYQPSKEQAYPTSMDDLTMARTGDNYSLSAIRSNRTRHASVNPPTITVSSYYLNMKRANIFAPHRKIPNEH
jgi:hypothetical protein